MCSDTNIHPPGGRRSQKKPMEVTRDGLDDCTKPDKPVHVKLQEWTVDTSGGISHKESLNTTQVKEPMLKGNHFYTKHYEISSGNTKGNGIQTPGVLPLEVIDTEVGDCNSDLGSKTRICNTHLADRVEFLNKSEDTQYSRCLGLEDNTLSKHVGFKLDTSIPSSTDNGDDNLSKILTVGSTNNPEVKNVEADSDLKARRLVKL